MEKVLIVDNLWAGYERHLVLKGINLYLRKGERIVIMGPSGSGKSTLLKCVVRLVEPQKGRIFLNGTEITSKRTNIRKIRAKTGFVFQSYNLFPHMTVLENVSLPLKIIKKMPKRKAEEKAREALSTVNMEEYENRYPLQLSGGQQQRVAIARAIAMDPILFLLDEPTSALDLELKSEVLEVLRRVAKRGMSMLIVTHEVDFAKEVADRIIFIDKGKLVVEGPPTIINSSKNERVIRFFSKIKSA